MIAGYLSGAEGELISDCAAINIPSHETGPLKSFSVSLQASSGSERNFQSREHERVGRPIVSSVGRVVRY